MLGFWLIRNFDMLKKMSKNLVIKIVAMFTITLNGELYIFRTCIASVSIC